MELVTCTGPLPEVEINVFASENKAELFKPALCPAVADPLLLHPGICIYIDIAYMLLIYVRSNV